MKIIFTAPRNEFPERTNGSETSQKIYYARPWQRILITKRDQFTDNPLNAHRCLHLCIVTKANANTVYHKKYAHGFCFAVLCCGYTLTDFPISTRLTSLALWQSNDCPSASKATLMNMDKYFIWNQYERLHNHNKAKHNKTVCIFLGIYCKSGWWISSQVYQHLSWEF